jgi:hypothetical protein
VGGMPGNEEASADRSARGQGQGGGDTLFFESERRHVVVSE